VPNEKPTRVRIGIEHHEEDSTWTAQLFDGASPVRGVGGAGRNPRAAFNELIDQLVDGAIKHETEVPF
jgi:hypothetical protein